MDERTIFRCVYCRTPMMKSDFSTSGACIECGAGRLQIAVKITDDEMAALVARGYVYDESRWSNQG